MKKKNEKKKVTYILASSYNIYSRENKYYLHEKKKAKTTRERDPQNLQIICNYIWKKSFAEAVIRRFECYCQYL